MTLADSDWFGGHLVRDNPEQESRGFDVGVELILVSLAQVHISLVGRVTLLPETLHT